MKKLSKDFIVAVSLLVATFSISQFAIIPSIVSGDNFLAQTIREESKKNNIYNLAPSKDFPGVFNFNYVFDKLPVSKEAHFDIPIAPFDEKKVGGILETGGGLGVIRDAWGYPVRENAFMKKSETQTKEKISRNILKTKQAFAYDQDQTNPSIYNCRANTSVTGYFKAYFEDVELNTGAGYDDQTYGEGRRAEACQVLQDISELIMLDETTVTPDILFMVNPNLPPGALAAASAYFGYYSVGPDNGSLHKHIISRVDPTPGEGNFDAFIITGFNGINWDVDSNLNSNTYDFYTVLYHEALHALGFRGLLPAAITSTNDTHNHDTLDAFSYKDDTLSSPFIDALSGLLQVPVGAPSPWFVTNNVIYRGIKNIVGATPDGIRPVFSPTSWQQGSSLSHFDMNRAPGEVYVMHPSIGTNTERDIHEHEEEVLCHLGYQVGGFSECVGETPWAADDFIALNNSTVVCIRPLLNDDAYGGGILTLNSLMPINIQSGDLIAYHGTSDCTGAILTDASGAKSFSFTPIPNASSRIMLYSNKDSVSGRISLPARIILLNSCNNDPEEYVCNGDFEQSYSQTISNNANFFCSDWNVLGQNLPYWQGYFCPSQSPSLVVFGNSSFSSNLFSLINGNYILDVNENFPLAAVSQLKESLIQGEEYKLSFDALSYNSASFAYIFGFNLNPGFADGTTWDNTSNDQDVSLQAGTFVTTSNFSDYDWYHFEQTFVPDNNYQYLVVGSSYGKYWFDNISIKRISSLNEGENIIKGVVYQDLNQSGSQETQTEPGLQGIQVGLFEAGNNNPVQTTTTQSIPNLGKYEFSNLSNGNYKVALIGESVYTLITEPPLNTILPGYSHARQVDVSGGQTFANNNFGVSLGVPVYGCTNPTAINYNPLATIDDGSCEREPSAFVDVKVTKSLIDSSLSVFDRYITWRIVVQNVGTLPVTNVLVKEIIPPGLVYHSFSTQSSNNYNPSNHMFGIPTILPGGQTYIDITMKVPNSSKVCGTKTNIAVLHTLDQVDLNSINNQGTAVINLPKCKITTSAELEPV